MNKSEAKKIREEAIRINEKNERISAIRKRIAIVGVVGLFCMFIGLFLGFSVSVDQSREKEITVSNAVDIQHLIGRFVNDFPSVIGDRVEQKELDNDGMWILADGIKYKVLISYDMRKGSINYNILFSEIGITGEWSIRLKEVGNEISISISETSQTDNLGYRSQLFFYGEDRYINNLIANFQN